MRSACSSRDWPGWPDWGLVALMIGAVLSTLLVLGASMVAMPAAVLVLVAVIAWGRRRTTADLIALARRH